MVLSATPDHSKKSSSPPAKPSSLACLTCRRKHLKCDGVMPVCSRCKKAQIECHYTPSRRGYKPSSKVPPTVSSSISDPLLYGGLNQLGQMQAPPWGQTGAVALSDALSPASIAGSDLASLAQPGFNPDILSVGEQATSPQDDSRLVDFYYAFFHDAHPILPPAHLLHRLAPVPTYLELVIKFIGSHFAPGVSSETYRASAIMAITNEADASWQKVQALLLLSIVLHARSERGDALEAFSEAVDLALKLGMNRKTFAENFGAQDPVREESIRRTWWELYIVDGLLAAFDQSSCRLSSVLMDLQLPADEMSYSTGVYLTDPPTPSQFYDRAFMDDELDFSSICYTIEAARILKRTLNFTFALDEQTKDIVESIEANIGSWFHHLPESKRHIMAPGGNIDEMLFRGHMIIHCASIYLHLPRSNLLSTPAANASIACAQRCSYLPPTSTNLIHATKAIQAANGLAGLASMRSSLITHTPFFICGLVLSAVVQLSACSVHASKYIEPRRDRIALIIGELKALNLTWAISRRVMQHIKMVAREVLEIGIKPNPYPQSDDMGPDVPALISNDAWLGDIVIEGQV